MRKRRNSAAADAMKQRIQYMYENGDQSLLTALVGADSITDL